MKGGCTALQDGASVSGLLVTTGAPVAERLQDQPALPAPDAPDF